MNNPQFLFFTEVSPAYREIYNRHFSPSWAAEFGRFYGAFLSSRACGISSYGTTEFNEQMMVRSSERTERANDLISNGGESGTVVVLCGCDIRFYPGVRDALLSIVKPGKVYCSADSATVACTDFMAFIPSESTAEFFAAIPRHQSEKKLEHDQAAINDEGFPHRAMIELLPHTFWTHGIAPEGKGVWDGSDTATLPPLPPSGIVIHHANFTIGPENKMRLLDHYKAAIDKRHATIS